MSAPSPTRRRFFAWTCIGLMGLIALLVLVSSSGQAQSPQSTSPGRWLEFDIAKNAALTAVVVGYFVPGQVDPVFSFEVPRAKLESPRAGVLRVPLIVAKLPAGQSYEVRLRTVNRRQRSGWSEPSGHFTVPEDGGAPDVAIAVPDAPPKRAEDRTPPTRKTGGRSAVNELKDNPELNAKLSKQFPGIDPAKAAEGFRTVRDLGVALFLAANLKIPFEEVKRLTADAGNRDFIGAITKLKPGVDARAEEQRALKESRQALRAPTKRRK